MGKTPAHEDQANRSGLMICRPSSLAHRHNPTLCNRVLETTYSGSPQLCNDILAHRRLRRRHHLAFTGSSLAIG
jgi:hypothetical protein